ncbi:MAG: serine protease [Spirochaetia bacterium]
MRTYKREYKRGFVILLLTILLLSAGAAVNTAAEDSADGYPVLHEGDSVESSVDISSEGSGYRTFVIEVPEDAFAVRLSISDAPADLDLFMLHEREIENYQYADYKSTREDYNETLFISRVSDPPLQDGKYYIDVTYQRSILPFLNWERLREIPFSISLEVVSASDHRIIEPDTVYEGELKPEEGMAKIYAIELPEGIEECRVDLFDTTADLDLLVGYEKPVLTRATADYVKETLLSRESIVLEGEEDEPELPGGMYYITVFDQVSNEHPVEFSLRVGLDSETPEELSEMPPLPRTSDELERALHSTVEIIGEAGRGSGCLVSEDGLILTNWHVVEGFSGEPSDPLFVALSYSPQKPPTEMFQAEVVEYDEEKDFALLEVVSGLYGQRVPSGYTFPYFRLGDPEKLNIGQPVSFLGYPSIGGTGSRASISLTRGIVSGFEQTGGRSLVKTDAVIHNGNSGGAAVDAYYELLGLPTVIIGKEDVSIGFVNPVSEIPEEWKSLIDRRNR